MDASQKKVLIIVLVVVGIGIIGIIGLLVLSAIGVTTAAHLGRAQIDTARTDGAALQSAAVLFAMQHPGGECPTPEALVASGDLQSGARTVDPWGQPFRITCDGDDIDVSSAGPDRTPGTADDVSAR